MPTPLPPGYREVRIQRRGGHPRGDYIGRNHPESRYLEIRSRSDGEHHPIDKASLLPEGAWVLLEAIFESARIHDLPVKEVIRMMNERTDGDPEMPLLSLVQHAIQNGHSRPDQTENATHGGRGAGTNGR